MKNIAAAEFINAGPRVVREDELGPYVRYRGAFVRHPALAPYVGQKVHVTACLTGESYSICEWLQPKMLHHGGWWTRSGATIVHRIAASVFAFLLAAPALAAPPAPPGPLAALAHQAAVEAAEEAGDPLEALLGALLEEGNDEEVGGEAPVEAEDQPAEDDEGAELDPAEEPADDEERPALGTVLAGNIVAAGWCALYQDEPEEDAPGCDAGVGAAFWRSHGGRLFVAGVVGQETAGFGFGVTAYRSPDGRVVVAGAVGVVAPYDDRGIDVGRAALAVGATFGVGGR